MESADKMVLIRENEINNNEKIQLMVKNALKLAKANAFNDDMNLIINKRVIKDTNVVEYLMNNNKTLKYFKEFENMLDKQPEYYTSKSPVEYKSNKNKQIGWISV